MNLFYNKIAKLYIALSGSTIGFNFIKSFKCQSNQEQKNNQQQNEESQEGYQLSFSDQIATFKNYLKEKYQNFQQKDDTQKEKNKFNPDLIRYLPIPALFTFFTSIILYRAAIKQWKKREFYQRINFTLNIFIKQPDGTHTLQIRTLLEKNLNDLVPNQHALKSLVKAAKKTNRSNSFIIFKISKLQTLIYGENYATQNWTHQLIYTNIQNEISQLSVEGHIAKSLNRPVISKDFVFALTREQIIKQQKIRVMIIEEQTLKDLAAKNIKLDYKTLKFGKRWKTLNEMAKHYTEDNKLGFFTVELSQPA